MLDDAIIEEFRIENDIEKINYLLILNCKIKKDKGAMINTVK